MNQLVSGEGRTDAAVAGRVTRARGGVVRNDLVGSDGPLFFEGPPLAFDQVTTYERFALTASPVFRPVLARLGADRLRLFGSADVTLEPVAEHARPASHVLELEVRRGDRRARLFVKVCRPDGAESEAVTMLAARLARDFTTTAHLGQVLLEPGVSVVRPVAYYPEVLALVTARVQGETLGAALARGTHWGSALKGAKGVTALAEALERLGRWIRKFGDLDAKGGSVSRDALRSYVDRRMSWLCCHAPKSFTPSDRSRLLARWDGWAAELTPADLSEKRVHGDLCLENILVDGPALTLLDFADTGWGTGLDDLTYLVLHLRLLGAKPWVQQGAVAELEQALLGGFGGVNPSSPLFQMKLLQHRLCHEVDLRSARGGKVKHQYRAWLFRRERRALQAT